MLRCKRSKVKLLRYFSIGVSRRYGDIFDVFSATVCQGRNKVNWKMKSFINKRNIKAFEMSIFIEYDM